MSRRKDEHLKRLRKRLQTALSRFWRERDMAEAAIEAELRATRDIVILKETLRGVEKTK